MLLLRLLVKNGFCPNIIKKKGNLLMVIEIPEASMRIISSNNYINGDEVSLALMFQLKIEPLFFPQSLKKMTLLNFEGEVPDFQSFLEISDTIERIKIKQYFYNNLKTNKRWCLKKELLAHSNFKLDVLTNSMLVFLKECFSFQSEIQTSLNNDQINRDNTQILMNQYVSPFNSRICSLSSLMFHIFGVFYQNYFDLHIIKNEYGSSGKNVSRLEHMYTSFLEYKNKDRNFLSAFNNENGQKFFKEAIPDLYCKDTKTAFFFQGCAFHPHDNCSMYKSAKTPFGEPVEEAKAKFEAKMANLMLKNEEDVIRIELEFECNFKQKLKRDPEMIHFFDNHYIKHPLDRLRPRNAMRGAYIDTYSLKWSKALYPNEKFYSIDINGLYSFCAIQFPYMTGEYQILIGAKLQNLKIKSNKFFYENDKIMGSIFLSILPPTNLMYPFLMYRRLDGSSINTLCTACSEQKLTSKKPCSHNPNERALIAVYLISEIEYALSLGYKILQIFEVHAYKNFDYILRPFVQILDDLKTKNSKNMPKRTFYKLAANSFFGKFAQKLTYDNIHFVTNQSELETVALTEDVQDILVLSDNMCMVYSKNNLKKNVPNLKYHIYIGSQITAYARQRIHSDIMILSKLPNCTLYHVNCDSIFFSLPEDSVMPLKLDCNVGNYKNVVDGEILSYFTLGPRQYNIFFHKCFEVKSITHVSGLSIETLSVLPNFENIFYDLLEKHEQNILKQFIFPQTRQKVDISKFKVTKFSQNFTLRNNVCQRRIIIYSSKRLATLPYGYQDTNI